MKTFELPEDGRSTTLSILAFNNRRRTTEQTKSSISSGALRGRLWGALERVHAH